MAFEMPSKWDDTAAALRELEPQAPKGLKPLMIQAAKELEMWQKLATDTARQLEEAANVRISQMATGSKVDEIQRGVKRTMLDLAARFKELQ